MNPEPMNPNQPTEKRKEEGRAEKTRETDFSQLYERALRTGKSRPSRLLYKFLAQTVRTIGYRYFSFTCRGAEHLNHPGPLIIAPTHRSNLDVPLLAPSSKRHIRSLAKDSMFKSRLSAWFSSAIGAVPVRRGQADRQSLRAVEQLLKDGEAVLVFPEGTRQTGPQVATVFDGCAYLAGKCSATVVPVGIAGTQDAMPPGVKLPRRVKVVACVGEPMRAAPGASGRLSLSQRQQFSQELQTSLQSLMDEAEQLRQQDGDR